MIRYVNHKLLRHRLQIGCQKKVYAVRQRFAFDFLVEADSIIFLPIVKTWM